MCGAKAHIHTWQEAPRSKPQDSWHSVHKVTVQTAQGAWWEGNNFSHLELSEFTHSFIHTFSYMILPGGTSDKELASSVGDSRDKGSIPGSGSWTREWLSPPVFLLGESHEQRSLEGYIPWVVKSWPHLKWLDTRAIVDHPGDGELEGICDPGVRWPVWNPSSAEQQLYSLG